MITIDSKTTVEGLISELVDRKILIRVDGGVDVVRRHRKPRFDEAIVMDLIDDGEVLSGPAWYGRIIRSGCGMSHVTFDRIKKRLMLIGKIRKEGNRWVRVMP